MTDHAAPTMVTKPKQPRSLPRGTGDHGPDHGLRLAARTAWLMQGLVIASAPGPIGRRRAGQG
jgi:hypothetical protein